GALLGVIFVVFSVSLISDAIFHTPAPETAGYAIEAAEGVGGAEGGEEAAPEPIAPLLASADPAAGEAIFKRCASCHSIEKGGPNKVGPDLWGIVNRPIAGHEGFSYSGAMKEFSEGGSVVWDYEHLNHFLESPKGYVPGTAMGFAGLKSIEDRANIIAYLRSQADEPAPLPDPADAAAAEGEGGEEGAAPAEEGEQAPAEQGEEAAPADQGAAPAEQGEETAPADQDAAPADQGEEAAPAEQGAAPAEQGEEAAPADQGAAPAEQGQEAAPTENEQAAP